MNAADRATAAQLIERWFQGTITNHEFDDAWPWDSSDKAVQEIGRELWSYFDDNAESGLSTSTLNQEQVSVLSRSFDFLKSDLSYRYEVFPQPKSLWGKLKAPFVGQPVLLTDEQRKYWPFGSVAERDQHRSSATESLSS